MLRSKRVWPREIRAALAWHRSTEKHLSASRFYTAGRRLYWKDSSGALIAATPQGQTAHPKLLYDFAIHVIRLQRRFGGAHPLSAVLAQSA